MVSWSQDLLPFYFLDFGKYFHRTPKAAPAKRFRVPHPRLLGQTPISYDVRFDLERLQNGGRGVQVFWRIRWYFDEWKEGLDEKFALFKYDGRDLGSLELRGLTPFLWRVNDDEVIVWGRDLRWCWIAGNFHHQLFIDGVLHKSLWGAPNAVVESI